MKLGPLYVVLGCLVSLVVGFVWGTYASVGETDGRIIFEGSVIEFLYIGENDTFLAKVDNSIKYRHYKFAGEKPKVGKYQIIGLGEHAQRGLLPLAS
ncbi:MAG: hypothetical protein WCJ74_00565 [bacterium]